jgi:hypothetical protein
MADGGHGHAHGEGCDHGGHQHNHGACAGCVVRVCCRALRRRARTQTFRCAPSHTRHPPPLPYAAHDDATGSSSSPGAVPFPLPTSARAHRGDDGDADLPRTFARAEALFHHVVDGDALPGGCGGEGGASGAHDEARHVRDGVAALVRCAALVRSTGAVSSNECVDDMRTEDLRYLLVEYYLAGLRQRVGDATARLAALEAAAVGLEAFVADCVTRRVVPASEAAALGFDGLLQQRAARPSAADTAEADDGGDGAGSTRAQQLWAQAGPRASPASAPGRARQDVAASRSQKIERYKRNVEAKKRLKVRSLWWRERGQGREGWKWMRSYIHPQQPSPRIGPILFVAGACTAPRPPAAAAAGRW